MKKQLPVAILALVVLLCSASALSAQVPLTVTITPSVQYASPQISEFWESLSGKCEANKTVTYTVTVEADLSCLPVWVSIKPGEVPVSWFDSELDYQDIGDPMKTWPLYITVPQTLGKDAGGEYTITVVARDSNGGKVQKTARLIVQDYDYVTETLVAGTADYVSITENYRNMAIATEVDKTIEFSGTVDCLTKNEYVIENAYGNNANYEQEATVDNYRQRQAQPSDLLYSDERFKSCAAFGGTGVDIHEVYLVTRMDSRSENINHHVTGDQQLKTELCTYNRFDGWLEIDAMQSVPCSKRIEDNQYFRGNNLTAAKHKIFRGP